MLGQIFAAKDYFIHLLILIGIYIILAQGLNINFGLARLFNLAHVAIYAIGAYTTALLSTELGLGFFPCVIASVFLGSLASLLLGAISTRLSEEYFAIGTLAFSSIVSALIVNWKSLTRGVLGIPGIPRPELLWFDFYDNKNFLVLLALTILILHIMLFGLFKSSYARSLRAQGECEAAALALGMNTKGLRYISFIMASALAALAGSFFAYYINYIDASSFSLNETVFVLTICVLGKPGSFWGVIAATIFLVLLPEPLRFINLSPSVLGPLRQMMYAVILFIVVYIQRENLFPVERKI